MSSFLLNLARRGAGLPTPALSAPRPAPFAGNIGGATQALQEGTAQETPVPSAAQEPLPTPDTRRPPAPEAHEPGRPFSPEPGAALNTPLSHPQPALQRTATQHARTARPVSVEPLPPATTPARERRTHFQPGSDGEVTAGAVEANAGVLPEHAEHDAAPADSAGRTPPGAARVQREGRVRASAESGEGLGMNSADAREPVIRPALSEATARLQFPTATRLTPPAQPPVHVRIGRIEVRESKPQAATPAVQSESPSLGFAEYYRVRRYRS